MTDAIPDITPLPWHASLWEQAAIALRTDRMAHGLLICGPAGVGKARFASRLSQALLCQSPTQTGDACGHCAGCHQWQADTHPDVSRLMPDKPGGMIRVDPLRDFIARLQLTPQYTTGRLGWIEPAEQLHPAAANSLLKTLEEPPLGTHLILISSYPERLLPTIRSRCRMLQVPPADTATARQWLSEQGMPSNHVNPDLLHTPLRLLDSDPETNPEADWQQALVPFLQGRTHPLTLAEQWADQPAGPWAEWFYRTTCALLTYRLTGQGLDNRPLADCVDNLSLAQLQRLCHWARRIMTYAETNANWQLVIESALMDSQPKRQHA